MLLALLDEHTVADKEAQDEWETKWLTWLTPKKVCADPKIVQSGNENRLA
jgi:hypothetical protein